MSSFVNSLHILAILSTDTKFANNLKEIVGNTKVQKNCVFNAKKNTCKEHCHLKALVLVID